jgi:anthranilate synthase
VELSYVCKGGMRVRAKTIASCEEEKESLIDALDRDLGAYFCSSFEYPGRYTRWDMGFKDPPIKIRTWGRDFTIEALRQKGTILIEYIFDILENETYIMWINKEEGAIKGQIMETDDIFPEEKRSKQPSVFSLIRSIREAFFSTEDRFLGLYGAFGYDLLFAFEKIPRTLVRDETEEMLLFIPDEIFIIDHQKDVIFKVCYDFTYHAKSTSVKTNAEVFVSKTHIEVKRRDKTDEPIQTKNQTPAEETTTAYIKGSYAKKVEMAKPCFKRGDFFEVVPSHVFYRDCRKRPSQLFRELKEVNPSPYGFFIHLGSEHLIGASPEMYVRVEGRRVETCPISGTIKRGSNCVEDANKIRELLNSQKDESELTMCTDVDRNDKSRICVPGSVNVIGRRQIEMYSHLIHTVDHVEGILEEGYDALDAFMTHMWAVTVTGAPKKAAVKWIENHEDSPRGWYGGAVGHIGFDGNMNTGLTLRTIRLKNTRAQVRVGATVLYDSIPEEEEQETVVKAAAMIKVLEGFNTHPHAVSNSLNGDQIPEHALDVLFVDHEDSFVHTLAGYFRKAGCRVKTLRVHLAWESIKKEDFDLVVLSPGPGWPKDFNMNQTIDQCLLKGIPIFGVCLGLQGIVEYFGGELGVLDYPMHGKPSPIVMEKKTLLFKGIQKLTVGRYHSLYAKHVPEELLVVAKTKDDVVMAVENQEKGIYGVQFHPESIMSMEDDAGFRIIANLVSRLQDRV